MDFQKDFTDELFDKRIYALKNRRRRSILYGLKKHTVMSIGEIQKHLQDEGFNLQSQSTIKDCYLKPLLNADLITKKDGIREFYGISSLGYDVCKIIGDGNELEILPEHSKLHEEYFLLALRGGRRTYKELASVIDVSYSLYRIIGRLRNLIEVNRPKEVSLYSPTKHETNIPLNPSERKILHFLYGPEFKKYEFFMDTVRKLLERNRRTWFTEYFIIGGINEIWKEEYGKPIDEIEVLQFLKLGVKSGNIKHNQDETFSLSKERMRGKFVNIFDGIDAHPSKIAEETGFKYVRTVYKILKKLKDKGLVKNRLKEKTAELNENGKRLANILFKIKNVGKIISNEEEIVDF